MVRIKYTGPSSTIQVQKASVQNKARSESQEVTQLRLQESLATRQQQSLEMVQIMLHVSFGTLFYLREFLPLGCFDDRDLKQAQREQRHSYKEFINRKPRAPSAESSQELAFGKGKRGQPLKVILRNSDPKADMILDLLEHGIFDALNKNFLDAIQLTLLVDKDEPQNVLESYTFSFKYSGTCGDVNSRLESLSLDPVGCVADMKSAQTARAGLEMIVRRLITLSAFLPSLPNRRHLGIHLFYTEDCPSEYEPPGFTMSTDEMIKYPFNENWKRELQSCGTMDSGCHTVGLNVTSLKWTGPDPEGSEAPPKIPSKIEYNDKIPRSVEFGFREEEDTFYNAVGRSGTLQEATQDVAERQKLQMMIPTQVSSYPDSDLVPTQPINLGISVNDEEPMVRDRKNKICLSQSKSQKIQQCLRIQNPGLAEEADNQDSGIVKCQCGWDGDESAMITCSFCHTRQHLRCYGFENPKDPRLPETHACYQCLLELDEPQMLREMHTLVLLRKALRIILDEGFPSKTSIFTQKLHCNGQTVVQITDILRKRKFIQPTPGSKSKGFVQKGLPKFVIPNFEVTRERIQREILDPLAGIRHHYILQTRESEAKSTAGGRPASQEEITPVDTQSATGEKMAEKSPTRERKISGEHQDRNLCRDELGHRVGDSSTESRSERPAKHTLSDDQTRIQPETPSRRSQSDNKLRRSARKKRKISNFSQLIDVGASSSGDESL